MDTRQPTPSSGAPGGVSSSAALIFTRNTVTWRPRLIAFGTVDVHLRVGVDVGRQEDQPRPIVVRRLPETTLRTQLLTLPAGFVR
jgi:hypothetical protein